MKHSIDNNLLKWARSGSIELKLIDHPHEHIGSDKNYSAVAAISAPFPQEFGLLAGDCIHNISAAYDHIVTEVVIALDGDKTRSALPVCESRQDVERELHKSKKFRGLPSKIKTYFLDTIKPYKDGNFVIWAARQLDNIDKHRMIVPAFNLSKIVLSYRGRNGELIDNVVGSITGNGHVTFPVVSAPIGNVHVHDAVALILIDEPSIFSSHADLHSLLAYAARSGLFAINDLSEMLYGKKAIVDF